MWSTVNKRGICFGRSAEKAFFGSYLQSTPRTITVIQGGNSKLDLAPNVGKSTLINDILRT